jgi:hypothetical protein
MSVQVHKVPEGYRKEELLKPLIGRSCGKVEKLEMVPAGGFRGDFVRARVLHDVRKPLTRFLTIVRGGKRSLFAVKYEKLGLLCYACRLIGHDYKECGVGVFEEKELKFGEWIYVTPPSSRQRGATVLRGGGRGGRDSFTGRGRGRGNFVDWRLHPERKDSIGEELKDTAASPSKRGDVVMSDVDANAKKRLTFAGQKEVNDVSMNLALITSVLEEDGDVIGANGKKRYKKEDGSSLSRSAAPLEDDRREQ